MGLAGGKVRGVHIDQNVPSCYHFHSIPWLGSTFFFLDFFPSKWWFVKTDIFPEILTNDNA